MKIRFTKMSGAGNDFVVLGPEFGGLKSRLSWLAKRVCPRKISVGADGLILVEHDGQGLFMHYFNSDGSAASFCGNGARCLVRYCLEKGLARGEVSFRSASGIHTGEVTPDGVRIGVKMPVLVRRARIGVEGGPGGRATYDILLIDAGVPHAVVFVTDLAAVEVESVGRVIRYHPDVGPEGANVDFVDARGSGPSGIRTYERGVEAETLACGSGCVAAALALELERGAGEKVQLMVASGDVLTVELASAAKRAALSGPAAMVFEGEIDIKELDHV
ncbi:MAG TPA: diaminopimelate epimerase [bacterium]|nr:diaminopimelate epimerase [bacterium]